MVGDEIVLKEHKAYRWIPMDSIEEVEWLEADVEVVRQFQELFPSFLKGDQ
jgi:hypothetical protein